MVGNLRVGLFAAATVFPARAVSQNPNASVKIGGCKKIIFAIALMMGQVH